MANVNIYNMNGDVVGSMELNDKIFGAEVNKSVLHSVVRAYLLNQRQGTQSTLTRTEVSGGGRKPWRQKAVQDRAARVLRSGLRAALLSVRSPDHIAFLSTRRLRELQCSPHCLQRFRLVN